MDHSSAGVVGVVMGVGGEGRMFWCVLSVRMYLCPSAEEAMKARREIADYIKNKRTERARIRVG